MLNVVIASEARQSKILFLNKDLSKFTPWIAAPSVRNEGV
jgi:hypothetical protein